MIKFNVVKNVEENDDNGGFVIVKINVNGIEKFVEYSFDFGGSLCNVDIVDENGVYTEEVLEEVFGEDIVEELYELDIF